MKRYFEGDVITREELEDMSKEELQSLAKENRITLYTTVRAKMIDKILEVWTIRIHHGDAFR